jgi:formate hydrogenlyase subunit 4
MIIKIVSALFQALVVVAISPLQIGTIRATKALLEGRRGGRLFQPWREVVKLLRKETLRYRNGSTLVAMGSVAVLASSLTLALVIPSVTFASAIPPDLFVIVSILTVNAVAQGLIGLANGTSFGGMGSSRHVTLLALAEPTLLIAIYALSIEVRTSNLASIIQIRASNPSQIVSPVGILVVASLVIAVLSETGRLPVDNPTTHLELTMIHEAMTLESSGHDLAFQELASWIKLTVLTSLLANLLLPWSIASTLSPAMIPAALFLIAKVAIIGATLGVAEVFLAKVRLFRVPELLAGSLAIAFIAVIISGVTAK